MFLNQELKSALEFLFPGYEQGRGPKTVPKVTKPKVAKPAPKAGPSSRKRKRRRDSDSEEEETQDPDSPKRLTTRQRKLLYNRVKAENSNS